MKRKILLVIYLLIFIFINLYVTICYATSVTLSQIVTTFNNCSTVRNYATNGIVWTASCSENRLVIQLNADNNSTNLEYILEGNILIANFSKDETLYGTIVTTVLLDCIGQLHGYSDGDVLSTLNSGDVSSYTIENEGFEVKQLSNESYQMKIDINKKFPLIDVSNIYIEALDLEELKDYISGNGSAQKSKGNIVFHKSGDDNDITVFVGEKDKLTENTYKSIISILQVMFNQNEKIVNYFKENYSSISGDKEFNGFKIEVNPEKSDMEKTVLGEDNTYKFIRITINKKLVSTTINETVVKKDNNNDTKSFNTKVNEIWTNEKSSNMSDKIIPYAGNNTLIIIVIILMIIASSIIFIKFRNLKDVK